MPIADQPTAAKNIAIFGGSENLSPSAVTLNYSVPLPGQLRNRRIIELSGITAQDQYRAASSPTVAQQIQGNYSDGYFLFSPAAAVRLWLRTAMANGVPGDMTSDLARFLESGTPDTKAAAEVRPTRAFPDAVAQLLALARQSTGLGHAQINLPQLVDLRADPDSGSIAVPQLLPMLPDFLKTLHETGIFLAPAAEAGGGVVTQPMRAIHETASGTPAPGPEPRLFLIEEWCLSSYLGDYGLGRTVKTMTLLPGEQLTMRFRTWRSSERSYKESSSIFDSTSREAQQRFDKQVERETTDKRAKTKTEEWHAEARVDAGWGWGSAEVSGGGSGQYHSSREQFASQLNTASQEHARMESSKREVSVTSATENLEKREEEESTERVIRNVNLRNTLNFVFRELNQEYETYIHLTGLSIGYTDGSMNSWREVPISQVHTLLSEVLVDAALDAVSKKMMKLAFRTFDVDGNPITVLEQRQWNPLDHTWSQPEEAALDASGELAAPSDSVYYRFKTGPLGQYDGALNHKISGVVVQRDTVVLRTDSIIAEALLGEADALDEYAMASQAADAEAKTIANRRENLLNDALEKLPEKERVEAYIQLTTSSAARLEIKQL